ncbi:hypothetical protein Y1Q_0018781 [Alligator mississippiensis]|uniref:Uncharacterized protein n=1 Tax=Alligator mississippiensis TaxID=8496 RepID=A0A151NSB9_ALLMI|nr:hypothetical protein Y1Q_0018781 [Alligator mississippiensis]
MWPVPQRGSCLSFLRPGWADPQSPPSERRGSGSALLRWVVAGETAGAAGWSVAPVTAERALVQRSTALLQRAGINEYSAQHLPEKKNAMR